MNVSSTLSKDAYSWPLFVMRPKGRCIKYRYSWDADDSDERRLTQILFIINQINLRESACSASSASGNINLTHPLSFVLPDFPNCKRLQQQLLYLTGVILVVRALEDVNSSKGISFRTGGDFRCFHLDVAGFYHLLEMMVAFGRVVDQVAEFETFHLFPVLPVVADPDDTGYRTLTTLLLRGEGKAA